MLCLLYSSIGYRSFGRIDAQKLELVRPNLKTRKSQTSSANCLNYSTLSTDVKLSLNFARFMCLITSADYFCIV